MAGYMSSVKHNSMCMISLYLLLQYVQSGPYDITCSDVISGVSGNSDDAATSVSCPSGILVSCGLKTHDATETNMDGGYFDANNNQCTARNGVHSPEGIYATARCCTFGIDISCNSISGGYAQTNYNGQDHSTASCNSGQVLTGCSGYGGWTRIGAYSGDSETPPNTITNFNINYENNNICTARNGDTARIKAFGECCSTSSTEYSIDCITRYGEGDLLSQVVCPNEYTMIGCSGYGVLGNTNAWYIENDICYSRSSNTENTWASAICCAVSHQYDGYNAGPNLASFSDAKAYCNSVGEILAVMSNADDIDAVHRLCDSVDIGKSNGCWIGLSKNNDDWQWEDGSNYLLEYIDVPFVTAFNDDCVAVPPEDNMNLKFHSYPCSNQKYPICIAAPTQSPTKHPILPTAPPTSCQYSYYCTRYHNPSCDVGYEQIGTCDSYWVTPDGCPPFGCSPTIHTPSHCRKTTCTTGGSQSYLETHFEQKHVRYLTNSYFYIGIMGLLIIINVICFGLWIGKQCAHKTVKKSYQYDVETDSD